MSDYRKILQKEFSTHASKWRVWLEAIGNAAGYVYAAYLWFVGAADWVVLTVGMLSGFVTLAFIYLSGRSAWEKQRLATRTAQLELKTIRSSSPKLRLREPGAVHIHRGVQFFATVETASGIKRMPLLSADFLKVSFINDPERPAQTAEAKGVLAIIEFFRGDRLLRQLHGRWSESTQPGERIAKSESTMDLLRMDFGIGDARTLDVAMKSLEDSDAYMYCNDNYHFPSMKPPDYALPPDTYRVRVRLRAVYVDEVFEFCFSHAGKNSSITTAPAADAMVV